MNINISVCKEIAVINLQHEEWHSCIKIPTMEIAGESVEKIFTDCVLSAKKTPKGQVFVKVRAIHMQHWYYVVLTSYDFLKLLAGSVLSKQMKIL